MSKMYETWKQAKDLFVKPRIKVYFGLWKKDPNLPTWRVGNVIRVSKNKCIHLPTWLSFYIFNEDVMWKLKFGEPRYEFPPQFTIVIFGLSLTITLHGPMQDEFCMDDHYWESILTYIYFVKSHKLKKTIEKCGIWEKLSYDSPHKGQSYFALRSCYIKKDKLKEYQETVAEINKDKNEIIL